LLPISFLGADFLFVARDGFAFPPTSLRRGRLLIIFPSFLQHAGRPFRPSGARLPHTFWSSVFFLSDGLIFLLSVIRWGLFFFFIRVTQGLALLNGRRPLSFWAAQIRRSLPAPPPPPYFSIRSRRFSLFRPRVAFFRPPLGGTWHALFENTGATLFLCSLFPFFRRRFFLPLSTRGSFLHPFLP